MYVTPRPDLRDDPLYAVRLAAVGTLAFAAIPLLDLALPPIIAALPVGLIAAQRKAFNPIKAIAGPITMIVMAYATTWLVDMLRDGFVQAPLVALVLGPLVYLVLPARTKDRHVDDPKRGDGNVALGAAIWATVLLGFSFWLYAVMQPSDMMMGIIAAMVLVFPTRRAVFFEAQQRIRATFAGSAVALVILWLFTLSPNLPTLLGLIFPGGLWLGSRMLNGTHPSMVYQYAFSVSLALIAGALSTQDPGYAVFTRIVLTLTGALAAALAVALLDALTGWRGEPAAEV